MWLDLGNAYGSVPHQLIESAMELYHILEKVQGIVRSYFGGMKIRFTFDDYTTSWQRVEKGIVTGWTKDALTDSSTTDQRHYGHSYSGNNNPYPGEMGPMSIGQ